MAGYSSEVFLYSNGGITYLAILASCDANQAQGVNDLGQVVGYCTSGDRDYQAKHMLLTTLPKQ